MIEQQTNLKKLNMSGNTNLSPPAIKQILTKLRSANSLQDLDISKLSYQEDHGCFRKLADLILQNRRLKSLSLQKTGLTDQTAAYLIEPLVRATNIETLKLDENLITG
jgi:Ran GTPase-activating protein (RanGAP) involved in mRNA processing and transport